MARKFPLLPAPVGKVSLFRPSVTAVTGLGAMTASAAWRQPPRCGATGARSAPFVPHVAAGTAAVALLGLTLS